MALIMVWLALLWPLACVTCAPARVYYILHYTTLHYLTTLLPYYTTVGRAG